MKITKAGFDSALTVAVSVAAAVLPILVAAGDIAATTAAAIGSGLAAVVGGYHGGSAVQAATLKTSVSASPETRDKTSRTPGADTDPSLPVE